MQDFDFSIRYRKGSMNTILDALSYIKEVNMLSLIEIKVEGNTRRKLNLV